MIMEATEAVLNDSLQVMIRVWNAISADPRVYNAILFIGILWAASEIKKKAFFVFAAAFGVYYALNWFGIDARTIGTAIFTFISQQVKG